MTVRTRFGAAGVVSLLVHAFVIFGLAFTVPILRELKKPDPAAWKWYWSNTKSQAETAAPPMRWRQHHLDGGGNTDAKTTRREESAAGDHPGYADTDLKLAQKRVADLEREARQVLTRAGATSQVDSTAAKTRAASPYRQGADADTAELMQRSLQIARLEAQISKDWNSYQERRAASSSAPAPRNTGSRATSKTGGRKSSASAN